MDIGEPIAIAIAKELTEECPFDHSDGPHDKTNNLRNDASALGASLGSGGENFEVTIRPPGKDMKLPAGVAAHHLIPGNESLAKASKLLKLMKKGKEVKGDVGYDVNNKKNRSEEHTSELQSRENLVCRLLLEKKKLTM